MLSRRERKHRKVIAGCLDGTAEGTLIAVVAEHLHSLDINYMVLNRTSRSAGPHGPATYTVMRHMSPILCVNDCRFREASIWPRGDTMLSIRHRDQVWVIDISDPSWTNALYDALIISDSLH